MSFSARGSSPVVSRFEVRGFSIGLQGLCCRVVKGGGIIVWSEGKLDLMSPSLMK